MAVLSPQGALQQMVAGNIRFATQKREFSNLSAARIKRTGSEGQKPFAAVLACADSRCPVEHIFDAGVGDLFTIRIAGNQSTNEVLGSLEYCLTELGTRLVVVLGHQSCGAVGAAAAGARTSGHIPRVLTAPLKAVARVQRHSPNLTGQELAQAATIENIWLAIEDMLRNSRAIAQLVIQQQIAIVGANYEVQTGNVDWLGEHPQQKKLAR